MTAYLPVCLAISIAWTLPELQWMGLTPADQDFLQQNEVVIDEEFAAALAMQFRVQTAGFQTLDPVPYQGHLANPNSTAPYWIMFDSPNIGCADSWDPFPTQSESIVAVQRWAVWKFFHNTITGRMLTLNYGIHSESQLALDPFHRVKLFPVSAPRTRDEFIEMTLLSLSEMYRYKKGYTTDGPYGLGLYGPDDRVEGERSWVEVDQVY